MCLPFLFHRDVRDTSDSHRCRWPHLWQQRSSGLQYPSWPAVLFRRPQNRWENTRLYPRLSHIHFIGPFIFDWLTLETKVCSNVETLGAVSECIKLDQLNAAFINCLSFHRLNAFQIIRFYSIWPGLYSWAGLGYPGHHSKVTQSTW